jgi:hypothetical protein
LLGSRCDQRHTVDGLDHAGPRTHEQEKVSEGTCMDSPALGLSAGLGAITRPQPRAMPIPLGGVARDH